jgi:hypothetical protein
MEYAVRNRSVVTIYKTSLLKTGSGNEEMIGGGATDRETAKSTSGTWGENGTSGNRIHNKYKREKNYVLVYARKEGTHIIWTLQGGTHIIWPLQEGTHVIWPLQEGTHIIWPLQVCTHIIWPLQKGTHII